MNEIERMLSIAQIGRRIRSKKKYNDFIHGRFMVQSPVKEPKQTRAPKENKPSGKKWCNYGKHIVDKVNFNKHGLSPDGLCYKCKPCQSHYQAMWKSGFLDNFKSLSDSI